MSFTPWTTVADTLAEHIRTVADIYVVHTAPPLDDKMQPSRWRKLLTPLASPEINSWVIHRASVATEFIGSGCEFEHTTSVTITGFLRHSQEEDSQRRFESIIDSVLLSLYRSIRLDDKVLLQGPAQLVSNDFQIVAGELCHFAEISTTTVERFFLS